MEYISQTKNVRMSPRKVRLVVEEIKKLSLLQAISYLEALGKRASLPVKKTLQSAIANATHNFKIEKESLVIKEILVNEGQTYKRYHFAARGRTRPYKKRTSHIKVVLEQKKGGKV